jgi:hypothetical protein
LHEALYDQSDHSRAHAALAYLQERSGEFQRASANYQQAYRQNRDPNIVNRLARLSDYSGTSPSSSGDASAQTASRGWSRRY